MPATRKVRLAYPWTETTHDEKGHRVTRDHKAGAVVTVDDVTGRALIRDGVAAAADDEKKG